MDDGNRIPGEKVGGCQVRERSWVISALAVQAAIVLVDAATGPTTVLIGFLVLGPLIASLHLDGRLTTLMALLAVATAVPLGALNDIFATRDHVLRGLVVASGGALAVWAAYLRTEREQAVIRLTQVAEVAQRAILRPIPAVIGEVAFATRYSSAAEEALIGGDLYDAAFTPYGLRVIVGDVKGKGLEAVQLAARVLGYFREEAFAAPDLPRLTRSMEAHLAMELRAEDFVTVVLAEFAAGEVRLVNCGHHPPLHIAEGLTLLSPNHYSPPLGLDPDPELQRIPIREGERLLFYTDGLAEARDSAGEMFRLDADLHDCLTVTVLDDALDELLARVLAHTGGGLDDDLAVVLAEPLTPLAEATLAEALLSSNAETASVPDAELDV
jgi:phosphoserine phosphatase RsbU/P